MTKKSAFNNAYDEPVADLDGGGVCVSAELYDIKQAAELFSKYFEQEITTEMISKEWAHFHGEFYDDEFINTWWRSSGNAGGDTPMVDKYEGKKSAKPLWCVNRYRLNKNLS